MIALEGVKPMDAPGRAALGIPEPKTPPIRNVAAYDILIRAGERLQKEAIENGSHRQLNPVDAYAPHWVTGGDGVHVNCREGYEMSPGTAAPNDAVMWDAFENTCVFNLPEGNELVVRIHCARRP
jgi:hypothetical protein